MTDYAFVTSQVELKANDPAPARTEPPQEKKNNQANYTTAGELAQHHYETLKASAISDEVIKERGYKTITQPDDLLRLGFAPAQCRAPGLLLPLHTTDKTQTFAVYRPDSPRAFDDKKHRNPDGTYKQKVIKYEMPKGEKMRLDCPPRCQSDLGNLAKPLWITEGQKKADALASQNLCAIALLGVWNFIGKNESGGKVFLPDFYDIALNGREVRIVFDSDVMTKPEVRKALDILTERLQRKGATVTAVYLTPGRAGKVGVDDWLAEGHILEELEALVEAPRPAPKVAPPVVELLDEAPDMIRRPLALIDGKAYAAVWPHVVKRISEKIINGVVIKLQEPEVIKEQLLHIIRNDGLVFGPWQIENPISRLGIDVHLPEPPTAKDCTWSTPGIRAYVEKGYRPDPLDIFARIKAVITRFIDFDRSLADQETMAEMLACFVLSTWFLDAFMVAPYIWANGERGSGKTSLLFTLVRLSYLGVSLSPSGSFAALRDLADYGATLGLDDAEDLTDPKKSDPDKRAILLSGNRKGISVHLKEPNPNGQGWITREVNCYCPRIFSTIQKPDSTLSSRAVIIPVVRTAQRQKGNADPLDDSQWPCNRQKLIDDLWSLALAHIHEMPEFDKRIGEKSKLIGRDLQPWRAILAIAAWLDSQGITGLWAKIESLASGTYQQERAELEKTDLNVLIVRAIGNYAEQQPTKPEWSFYTHEIVDAIHRMIDDEELEQDKNYVTGQIVGHRLKKMRLTKHPTMRPRGWTVTRQDLAKRLASYRLPVSEKISQFLKDSGLGDIDNIVNIVNIVTDPDNPDNHDNVNPGETLKENATCNACGGSDWWTRFDGVNICARCHPNPNKAG